MKFPLWYYKLIKWNVLAYVKRIYDKTMTLWLETKLKLKSYQNLNKFFRFKYKWKSNSQREIKLKLSFCFDFKPLFSLNLKLNLLLWIYYTSQIIELNKSISASQPILINRYQWIGFIQSKHWFSSEDAFFPIIYHNSVFSTYVTRASYLNKWKDVGCCSILKQSYL